jgi:hypothetical protein
VPDDEGRKLPVKRLAGQLEPAEVASAALAAAGGIVAGAATVAAMRAARSPRRRSRRRLAKRTPQRDVIASRSFLVDIHLLGK